MSLYLSTNKFLYEALICAFKTELNIYINCLMDNSNKQTTMSQTLF